MRDKAIFVKDRFTKCNSGASLNKLMHPFLFITLALSIGFLFFGHTQSVQAFSLYLLSLNIDGSFVTTWGLIGLISMILHTLGFLIRGKYGVMMMMLSLFGGFYLWTYAIIIFAAAGYILQILVVAGPNLYFWGWYAIEWNKRKRGEEVAFV